MGDPRERRPGSDLLWVLGWIATLWLVELIDVVFTAGHTRVVVLNGPGLLDQFGVRPRETLGLFGILAAPFLHGGFGHLIANSLGLLLLGWLSCLFGRTLTLVAAIYAVLIGGLLTWLVAAPGTVHVGASGVLFGLMGFLLLNGIVRRNLGAFFIALAVLVLYGGSLLSNLLPSEQANGLRVSWQMHLGGFVGGLLASWHLRAVKPQ